MLGGLVGLVVLIIMREVLGMREVVNNARDDFHEMASSFFFSIFILYAVYSQSFLTSIFLR